MNITNILWLAPAALQMGLIVLLLKRRAHRTFRLFLIYTLFAMVMATTKFLLRKNALLYFYLYWSAEAMYAVLGFAALYEAYHQLFRRLYFDPRIKFAFPATALGLLAFSALWLSVHGQPPHAIPLLRIIFTLEFAVGLLQFGFFALIIFLAVYQSDSTRRYGYGIAAGFGIAAFGIFADALIFSEFGTKYRGLLSLLSPIAYLVAVLIWLQAFARREPPDRGPAHVRHDPWQLREQLQHLKKDGKDLFGPWLKLSWFRFRLTLIQPLTKRTMGD